MRTWAPKGQTPIIQFHFNWKHVSVIAGLTRTNFLFRFHDGSIKSPQIVDFLKALRAHLKRKLLIVWDGLKAHGSRLVRSYLDSIGGGHPNSLPAAVCAGLQSGGVFVGMAQASCAGQLLPGHLARTQDHRSKQAQKRSAPTRHHHGLLETGGALVVS